MVTGIAVVVVNVGSVGKLKTFPYYPHTISYYCDEADFSLTNGFYLRLFAMLKITLFAYKNGFYLLLF